MITLYLFLENNVFNRNTAFEYKENAKATKNKKWCNFAQSFIKKWDEYVINNPENTCSGVKYKSFLKNMLAFVEDNLGKSSTLTNDIKTEIENQNSENQKVTNLSDDILRLKAVFNLY